MIFEGVLSEEIITVISHILFPESKKDRRKKITSFVLFFGQEIKRRI